VLKSIIFTEQLSRYVLTHSRALGPVAERLVLETAAMGRLARQQISPDQGVFLRWLAGTIGARRILEVGTFTGLSALLLAETLPADGHLVALDLSNEWTTTARRFWQEAGLAERIELRLGPALESLHRMAPHERFDLAFIDADKTNYVAYYEEIVPRLDRGGVLAADNTLWSGRVLDPRDHTADTEAIRAFNRHLADDPRVEVVLLPIADGLTLARVL
jgi:caffeoyl-CoA O-methyltransferase